VSINTISKHIRKKHKKKKNIKENSNSRKSEQKFLPQCSTTTSMVFYNPFLSEKDKVYSIKLIEYIEEKKLHYPFVILIELTIGEIIFLIAIKLIRIKITNVNNS